MSNLITAILFNHVVNDFLTAIIVKIDINIRHGHSFRIQKSLKQQIVLKRVNIRNTCAIGHHGTSSRPPSRPHIHSHFPCRTNKILYNQEIAGKSHRLNNIQFMIDAVHDLIGNFIIMGLSPFHC